MAAMDLKGLLCLHSRDGPGNSDEYLYDDAVDKSKLLLPVRTRKHG
jgi:hypothetical protein